jgi:hypothetical protein
MVFGDLTAGQSSAAVPQASHKGQTRSCSSVRGTGWEGERGARRFLEAFGRPLVLSGRQTRGALVVVSHGRYPADQSMRDLSFRLHSSVSSDQNQAPAFGRLVGA